MDHWDGEGEQHVLGAWEEKKGLGQDQEFPGRILRRTSFPYRKWYHPSSLRHRGIGEERCQAEQTAADSL